VEVLTLRQARARFGRLLRRVVRDRRPVTIVQEAAGAVVLVPVRDWAAMEETLHLLSSAANAARLRSAIEELDQSI
jgi:antitoxin YefM